MSLTRDQILSQTSLRKSVVEVPEWGGSITLRAITVAERDTLEQFIASQKGNIKGIRPRLLRLCAVDDSGAHIFTDADTGTIEKIDASVAERLIDECMKLCGLKQSEVAGNSKPGP